MRIALALLAGLALTGLGCDAGNTAAPLLAGDAALRAAGPPAAACANRNNNTPQKLLECVTVEGVRTHQAAFQSIADANNGRRDAGTPGADASVEYVAARMRAAGYAVTVQSFSYPGFVVLAPSTLAQVAPVSSVYTEGVDYAPMSQTDPGDVTAAATAVDLQLGPGNTSTSGCEAADFAGFPAGNLALIQRGGGCTFQTKAENAAAAGATGVILFNQGNTPARLGLINGTLGAAYAGGIPVVEATYNLGVTLASTPGLVMRLAVRVRRGMLTASNVLAETGYGDPNHVVVVGTHLDSANGPGINQSGSGSAALIEIATYMRRVESVNRLRFAWWNAREAGLEGSSHYVTSLSGPEREAHELYLEVRAIGSPNGVRFVLDPALYAPPLPGSEAVEAFFQAFYAARSLPAEASTLLEVSDFSTFSDVGIPFGGITAGSQGTKSPAQAATYGGVAGVPYDPCRAQACDTYANVSLNLLDQHADAAAAAALHYALTPVPAGAGAPLASRVAPDRAPSPTAIVR